MASSPASSISRLTAAAAQINRRYGPWIALVVGATTAWLWRAGVDQVRAALALASLAGAVALLLLFPPWDEARGPAIKDKAWVRSAAWWTTVNLAQNALWFVIPFYILSTTWASRNTPFTLLLVALGILSCFDLFLRERLLRGGWAAVAFVVPALLAALQLFLPILTGLPPRFTIFASGAIAAFVGACLIAPDTFLRRSRVLPLAATAVVGALAARAVLPLLAPAPLRIAQATFALGRNGLEPVSPVESLQAGPSEAYVFMALEAPRGLTETVRLVVDGEDSVETRPLEIQGGRAGGYRLWAPVKTPEEGRVRATVRTEGGQVVGAVSILVVPSAAVSAPAAPSAVPAARPSTPPAG
jgi:hypothetical protein